MELYQRIEQLIGKRLPKFDVVEEEVMMLVERVTEAQRFAKMVSIISNSKFLIFFFKFYLTTLAIRNIFVRIQWVDFQIGRVILTNYLNSHPSLGYSGHTAFKLVKRGCLFHLRRKTIPQHCTTISKTTFKIVCFRFWKC